MLPTKVRQIDYVEIQSIIDKICDEKFISMNFDCVFTDSISGTFVASLISKKINIPMIYSGNKNYEQLIDYNKIILVDLICYDDNLNSIKKILSDTYSNKEFFTLGVLIDDTNSSFDFIGLKDNIYYLTPWNIGSYTPNAHLERLLENSKTSYKKQQSFIGISSKKCFETISLYQGKLLINSDYSIFDEDIYKKVSSSQINTSEKDNTTTIQDYYLRNKPYFLDKIDFINNNGITHFYEDSIKDSIIIAYNCPITNVFFIEGNSVYSIKSKNL